jgi:RNA polymerase sigma-70 factor (ECF subfamily)
MDTMGISAAAAAGVKVSGDDVRGLASRDHGREAELVAAMAAGDRGAAERLVERTYQGVYSLLRRLCGETDLAADLTQETYRRAWDSLASFESRAQFSTWLCRIAYNVFLNHLRRPRRLVPLDDHAAEMVRDPAPAADQTVGAAAEGQRLRRAVLLLPEEQRFTVIALYWGGRSVREVALAEGVSGVAIRKRLKRAMESLNRALAGKQVEP